MRVLDVRTGRDLSITVAMPFLAPLIRSLIISSGMRRQDVL